MKLLLRLALGALGLLVAALVVLTFYIDRIVGQAIERGGTYAFGVDTHVGLVSLSPLGGSLRMSSLEIANPPGFEGDHFLELGGARLDVEMRTLRESTVEVPLIELSDVDVVLARQGQRTNADVILAHMKSLQGSKKAAPPEDTGAGSKQLVVDELVVRNLTARVQLQGALGQAGLVPLEIPEIRLTNVGRGRKLTYAELSDLVVKAIMTAIVKQGTGVLPGMVLSGLTRGLTGLPGLPGKLVLGVGSGVAERLPDAVARPLESAGEAGRGAARAVTEGAGGALRGLFDRDDSDKK